MNHVLQMGRVLLLGGCLAGAVLVAGQKPAGHYPAKTGDTTRPGHNYYSRHEDDYHFGNLDSAMNRLDRELATLNVKMAAFDGQKLQQQIDRAYAEVDMKKVRREVDEALKKIDWDKLQAEVQHSLTQAQKEVTAARLENIRTQVDNEKIRMKLDSARVKIDGTRIRKQVEESLEKAKLSMERARADMENMKEFTAALEHDGLISRRDGYLLELSDGRLSVNGVTQSREVTERYSRYYKKDHFKIRVDGEKTRSF